MAFNPALIIGLMMIVAAVYYGGRMMAAAKKTQGSNSWPMVPCEILSSQIRKGTDAHTDTPIRTFTPEIEYRYEVDGRRFVNNRITHGATMLMEGNAERLTDKYPAGSSALAHYNPVNPADSVLEPSSEASAMTFSMGIALLFLVVGVIMTAVALL